MWWPFFSIILNRPRIRINQDRARKALKAGLALNSRSQPSAPSSGPRTLSNGSSANDVSYSNGDSVNNNSNDDEDVVIGDIMIVSNCDDGDGTVLSNGHVRVNGLVERKLARINVNRMLSNDSGLMEDPDNDDNEYDAENEINSLSNGDLEQHERFSEVLREIKNMVFHLDVVSQNCTKNRQSERLNDDEPTDRDKFAAAKEALIGESRQFVTASKLFVKSATESSDKVVDHLVTCVTLLDRIFAVSELVLTRVSSSLQVTSLVEKLKEVALAYSNTVVAARMTVGKNATNPDMCALMHQATALATALTTLMRTLRTFGSP